MRCLSAAQERILAKCGDQDTKSRVFERVPSGFLDPLYSWELEGGRCTRQTMTLLRHGYIFLGAANAALGSRPWLLTDLGRAYKERYLS